jgi:DNA invertase Pin-like site-specific DNA recombinase
MSTAYNVGIYCRLSEKEAGGQEDTSISIQNQQAIIERHVANEGWNVYKVYIDDGKRGVTFDRPQFNAMVRDIKDGKLNCVITKDITRLGRNSQQSSAWREFFLEHGVRYISLHNGIDIKDEDDDDGLSIALMELISEHYPKSVSKNVRKIKKEMAQQGKFSNGRAPYGYVKSPENKHILVVDENVAHNVARIYRLYNGGMTGRAIADLFNSEGIPTANTYYYCHLMKKPNPYNSNKDMWGSATVMNILKNPTYYGAIVNGKRTVKSYKDKRIIRRDESEWIIIEDKHTPIVTREMWDNAQAISKKNHKDTVRRSADGEVSIFASILKCADCGGNMVFNRKENKTNTREYFRCSTYTQKGKDVCPMHSADYDVIYQAVLKDIQQYAVLAIEDEHKLIKKILNDNNEFKNKNVNRYTRLIRESKNRVKQIDELLVSLFEEKLNGDVSDTNYKRMMKKYEDEQTKLSTDISQMENELEECQRVQHDLSAWIERVKDCITIDSLTRQIAVELIDRIEVSETYSVDGKPNIDLHIVYRFGIPTSKSNAMTNKIAC